MGKVEFTDNSKPWIAKLNKQVDIAVGASSEYLAQNIQDSMPGAGASVVPGTGGDTGNRSKYIASNPGSPPGIRTNRLKGSITSNKTGKKKQRSVGDLKVPPPVRLESGRVVGGPVKYAKHLEYGTSKMAARPFIRPGLKNSKRGMLRVFTNTLKKGMR